MKLFLAITYLIAAFAVHSNAARFIYPCALNEVASQEQCKAACGRPNYSSPYTYNYANWTPHEGNPGGHCSCFLEENGNNTYCEDESQKTCSIYCEDEYMKTCASRNITSQDQCKAESNCNGLAGWTPYKEHPGGYCKCTSAPAVWSAESVTLICRDDGASALSVVSAISFTVTAAVLVY